MPWKQSKTVPDVNDPFPHHVEFGCDEPTMADLYRTIIKGFDRSDKQFDEFTEKMRATNQRLTGLQHGAQQPRFATEADT